MHRVILAAHSDFFEALFSFEDKKEYKIEDPNLTQEVLKIILDSFYEMNCFDKTINVYDDQELDTILEVIATAEYLIAPFLLKKAIKLLMESLEEAIPTCIEETRGGYVCLGGMVAPYLEFSQAAAKFDKISKILDFSRNFQVKELENQILSNWDGLEDGQITFKIVSRSCFDPGFRYNWTVSFGKKGI